MAFVGAPYFGNTRCRVWDDKVEIGNEICLRWFEIMAAVQFVRAVTVGAKFHFLSFVTIHDLFGVSDVTYEQKVLKPC